MTLLEFIDVFDGGIDITIEKNRKKYCEEKSFNYDLSENKGEYDGIEPFYTNIQDMKWWNELKDCEIVRIVTIGGGVYNYELIIELEEY
ncbi:MAG: hypothetical protein HFJ09_09705 [Lachnospiraceae bacterium]|nr:hypothetical protein [Lachnospiraceae bacterium]